MILLFIMNAYAALVDHYGFTTFYRLDVAGIPISFLDLFLFLALIAAILQGPVNAERYPNKRTHPGLQVAMGCLITACVLGVASGLIERNPFKDLFSDLREYAALPVCIFAGYRLLPNPRWATRYVYVLLWLGVGTATVLLWHFGTNAEEAGLKESINLVRETNWESTYAVIAAPIFAYLLLARVPGLPLPLKIFGCCYCVVGAIAPLTRSDWLAMIAGFILILLLLPRHERFRIAFRMIIIGGALAGSLYLGIQMAGNAMQKDFGQILEKRVESLNPWDEESATDSKAWDSRVVAYLPELQMFLHDPLMGSGFGTHGAWVQQNSGIQNYGFRHNGWSAVLAQVGIIGLVGNMTVVFSMLVIGYRLARDRVDRGSMLIGAYSMVGGITLLIYVLATMTWTTRTAMLMGTLCGAMFRCRDMQATTLAQFAGYVDAPDEHAADFTSSNPLVPDELIEVQPFVH